MMKIQRFVKLQISGNVGGVSSVPDAFCPKGHHLGCCTTPNIANIYNPGPPC